MPNPLSDRGLADRVGCDHAVDLVGDLVLRKPPSIGGKNKELEGQ
jgi:hypothetical protein